MTYIQAALKRDGDSFSPPLLGIHTLSWARIPLDMEKFRGKSSLPFASLACSLISLTLWLGEGVVELVHGTAFSLQLAPNAIL